MSSLSTTHNSLFSYPSTPLIPLEFQLPQNNLWFQCHPCDNIKDPSYEQTITNCKYKEKTEKINITNFLNKQKQINIASFLKTLDQVDKEITVLTEDEFPELLVWKHQITLKKINIVKKIEIASTIMKEGTIAENLEKSIKIGEEIKTLSKENSDIRILSSQLLNTAIKNIKIERSLLKKTIEITELGIFAEQAKLALSKTRDIYKNIKSINQDLLNDQKELHRINWEVEESIKKDRNFINLNNEENIPQIL